MIDEGWIKLHRRFLNWEWRDTPEMVSLFVHLLLEANHEDRKWHGLVIQRGQIVTSRENLSKLTGLSVQQVRTCLARFEQTGEISKKSTNKYTLITVSNYDRYQVQQPADNQQITNNQPSNNHQITTNKNIKKERIDISPTNIGEAGEKNLRDWRFVSSVVRSSVGFDKDRIAEVKAAEFYRQTTEVAQEIGMTPQQVEAFVRWWTEHSPGSERLKAEYETTFDIRSRARNWMERDVPRGGQAEPTKTRLQKIADERNKFQQVVNGIFDNIPADGDSDRQFRQ